jgi:hypothetical protein
VLDYTSKHTVKFVSKDFEKNIEVETVNGLGTLYVCDCNSYSLKLKEETFGLLVSIDNLLDLNVFNQEHSKLNKERNLELNLWRKMEEGLFIEIINPIIVSAYNGSLKLEGKYQIVRGYITNSFEKNYANLSIKVN